MSAPAGDSAAARAPADPAHRLAEIRQRVADACRAAGRDPAEVTIVAASKTVGPADLERAIAAGQRVFAENRVQETAAKWPGLRERHPDLFLHLIGPLQSNKARDAVRLFDTIQTLDRASVARAVAEALTVVEHRVELFVQVNTGAEKQKAGVAVAETDRFLHACRADWGLDVTGLMCIPPITAPPEPHFELLAGLAERHGLRHLSMGMSGDFVDAIRCGATHVRLGNAIFGARPPRESESR